MALSQTQMKRLTAIHGWSAVVLGFLLYAVIATGAVAVFAEEIGRWSVGGVRAAAPMDGKLDATVRRLASEVDPEYLDDVGMWAGEGDDLHVFFHTHAMNPEFGVEDDLGTMFRVDATTGKIIERHDGFIWRDPAAYESSALRQFLVDLHVQLYVPSPWGLILTGILGLMMMAAVVSGILMHRHVIRDLFVAERGGGRLVSARDRHVLASTWAIPFAFVLAFTGSFFSFAGSVGLPLVAAVAFGGDEDAMIETLYEPPVPEDATPAMLASLDYIVADSRGRAEGPVTYVDISHFGRADARVDVWHDPADGGMLYVANHYDGPSREFLERRATIGTAPSAGATFYGLMYPLHFGHFAGIVSKAVWGALGVSVCFVILSGFRLWTKRRADSPEWQRFGRAVQIAGYGLPIAMLASAWGFFLSHPAGDAFWWTPASFVIGAAVAIAMGLRIADDERFGVAALRLMAVACLLLPVLRIATGGMDWATAMLQRQGDILTIDALLAIAGVALWAYARRETPRRHAAGVMEPAE